MPAPFRFSIQQITYYQGAMEVPEGPSASFVFTVAGTPPSAQSLSALEGNLATLLQSHSGGITGPCDFDALLPGGNRGRLADWVSLLACLLQRLAGDPVGPGVVRPTSPESALIFASLLRRPVFHKCLEWSLQQLMVWLGGEHSEAQRFLFQSNLLRELDGLRQQNPLGEAGAHVLEARREGIPPSFPGGSLLSLGWGTGMLSLDLAQGRVASPIPRLLEDRYLLRLTLARAGIPVPRSGVAFSVQQAEALAVRWKWPVVVHPILRSGPQGCYLDVSDAARLHKICASLMSGTRGLIVEEFIPGQSWLVSLREGVLRICAVGSQSAEAPVLHSDNEKMLRRAGRILGLRAVDLIFVSTDPGQSWHDVGGAVCSLRPADEQAPLVHANPRKASRIPVAALTGSNGKTTTCRMLASILRASGLRTGLSTSLGVSVDDEDISRQNLSGEPGGRMLLHNPDVQAAVLEMPRQGLLRFGHPCDHYDVAALLNVLGDHVGEMGVNSNEEMAALKGSILRRATRAMVLPSGDPCALAAAKVEQKAPLILFSPDASCPVLRAHLAAHGDAVYVDHHQGEAWLFCTKAGQLTPLLPVAGLPSVLGGLLRNNLLNALAAAALAQGLGIPTTAIVSGLSAFTNSAECNPGRLNFIDWFAPRLILDSANNAAALSELVRISGQVPVEGRRFFVCTEIGNLHRKALAEAAPLIAGKFDHYILSCQPRWMSREAGYDPVNPVASLLHEFRTQLEACGVASNAITTEPDPKHVIRLALASARKGDLIVLGSSAWTPLRLMRQLSNERQEFLRSHPHFAGSA